MQRWRAAVVFVVLGLLFLAANRGAYRSYFSDDDLDNIVKNRGVEWSYYLVRAVSPAFDPGNFRPVGHVYYRLLGAVVGLDYRWYIGVIHALHLLNCLLVWLLLRRLGALAKGALAGALIFAFHIACFDAWWKPMYVFDVLCATFTLLSLLLYLYGHWIVALVPFWLAYKAKEPAVALPAALLVYEWLMGERRWKRVLPFAAVSVSFGAQALVRNTGPTNDYTLTFSPSALWTTFSFYSSKVLLAPWFGVLLAGLFLLVKDKRVRFGLLSLALLLGPMWFLPGRLYSVYLYLPLAGLAIAACFLAERLKPVWIALFFAAWLPLNYQLLRIERKAALTTGPENRAYVESVGRFLGSHPDLASITYENGPSRMEFWGVQAAYHWFRPGLEVSDHLSDSLPLPSASTAWDPYFRRLLGSARTNRSELVSLVDWSRDNPLWQLGDGWEVPFAGIRWTAPVARATLRRPAKAREFLVRVNLGPDQFKRQGGLDLEIFFDGQSLGTRKYRQEGWHEQRWPIPALTAETVTVTLRTVRPFGHLGAAVAAFGFVE